MRSGGADQASTSCCRSTVAARPSPPVGSAPNTASRARAACVAGPPPPTPRWSPYRVRGTGRNRFEITVGSTSGFPLRDVMLIITPFHPPVTPLSITSACIRVFAVRMQGHEATRLEHRLLLFRQFEVSRHAAPPFTFVMAACAAGRCVRRSNLPPASRSPHGATSPFMCNPATPLLSPIRS